jgi:UDP-glucuronate decarboxylase
LGMDEASRRIACFGSSERPILLDDGSRFAQQPLAAIADLAAQPTLVLHLAFLTKDKVAGMDEADYRAANRAVSETVAGSLDAIGADRLFVASSGAAAFADDDQAAPDLRLYGQLKRADELLFAQWARAAADRRAVIARIFSLSGRYINKHSTYALASFIHDALAGRPVGVRAPIRVVRSYVAIRELMSLVFAALLAEDEDQVLAFDSGGTPMELATVAACVADAAGDGRVDRVPVTGDGENFYAGDGETYQRHLARYGIDPVDMRTQVVETAAYLAQLRTAGNVAADLVEVGKA